MEVWFRSFSFVNGWFVGSMLIFQGVDGMVVIINAFFSCCGCCGWWGLLVGGCWGDVDCGRGWCGGCACWICLPRSLTSLPWPLVIRVWEDIGCPPPWPSAESPASCFRKPWFAANHGLSFSHSLLYNNNNNSFPTIQQQQQQQQQQHKQTNE